jgi:hypothetical protein
MTLKAKMAGTDVRSAWEFAMSDWKIPDLQTHSINTNIAAKNIRVHQSILRITSHLLELKRRMGRADIRAM